MSPFFSEREFGHDLRLRYNEIRCVHRGVNPFRIWNHESALRGFKPLPRPDMDTPACNPDDEMIHAYPPWHNVFFFFLGFLSWPLCLSLVGLVFGICLYGIFDETYRLVGRQTGNASLGVAFSMAMIAFNVTICFFVMNYGILVLMMFLIMNRALEKNREFLAGLCWALMMVKPQVGILFVWPLLWHRRYVAIMTAVGICLGATAVAAVVENDSMIDLILQIPKIGKPYGVHLLVERFVKPVLGDSAAALWMLLAFSATGVATWLLRKRDFMSACVPVSLAITLWTYSQWHDRVILLVLMIALVGRMLESRNVNRWIVCGLSLCVAVIALRLLPLARLCGFGWAGQEWIFQVFQGLELIVQAVFVLFFVVDEVNSEKMRQSGLAVA